MRVEYEYLSTQEKVRGYIRQCKEITIKWWQRILLFFLPTYVNFNDGYALFYKKFRGIIYYAGCEKLPQTKGDKK